MPKSLQKIFKNSFYLFCMNLSTLAALFIFSVLLARVLGKEMLGLYALFAAILMPFSFFVDFGQSTSLVKEINKKPLASERILQNTIFLKILLAAVASVLWVVFSLYYFDHIGHRQLFWLFGLIILPRAFYASFEAALRAKEKMHAPMWVGIASGLLLIAGSWALLENGFRINAIIFFLVGIEFFKALMIWLLYWQATGFQLFKNQNAIDLSFIRKLSTASLPFFYIGIIGILHYRLDVMFLAVFKNTSEVGIFSAANNFVKVLRIVPSVIVASFFPAISKFGKDVVQLKSLSSKTLWFQLGASLMMAIAIFLLADILIAYTYQFDEATAVLRLSVWSIIPLSLYSTLVYVFFKEDRASWNIKILSGAVIINVILNILLIPRFGAMALAISNLVSESFCFILYLGLYRSLLKEYATNKLAAKPQAMRIA